MNKPVATNNVQKVYCMSCSEVLYQHGFCSKHWRMLPGYIQTGLNRAWGYSVGNYFYFLDAALNFFGGFDVV